MDWDMLIKYVTGGLAIIAIIGQARQFFSSGEKQIATDLVELKALVTDGHTEIKVQLASITSKLTEHDRRIQALENEMKHLPDRDAVHKIELAMVQINGRLDTMNETLKPIKANGDALNELLMRQAAK